MFENLEFLTGGKFISKGKWIHPTRTISSTEIIAVTEGTVNISVNNDKYVAKAGDVIRILPGEKHGGFFESEGVSFFWIHFCNCEEAQLPPRLCKPQNFERVELLAKELLHYANTDSYPRECADALSKVLLLEIIHGTKDGDNPKLIAEIKDWVKRNRRAAIKTAEIARHFGYSEDYLNRIFKKSAKTSLKKYVDTTRLEGIKRELLVGSQTLSEIADGYGFPEYKYFIKFFKYHTGISPRKYRETYYNMHTNSQ